MANQPIYSPKQYKESLRKIEVTDPVHANVVNPLLEQLINNDAFLRDMQERLVQNAFGNFIAAPAGTSALQFTFSGLTATWTGGPAYVNGRLFDVQAGSIELNPNQEQYLYLDSDGVIKKTTSQATAEAGLLLWYFATDASAVITSIDKRKIISPDTFARKEEVVMKEPGKGLSTNDYTNEEKAKVADHETRIGVIEEEIGEGTPFPVTLLPGLNIFTVPRDTPFNVLNLTGRTLINLLGRDGNCEDTSKWTPAPSNTLSLDNRYVVGAKGIFVSNPTNGQNAYFYKQITLDPNKYYYFSGYALSYLEVAFIIGTEVTTGTGGGIVRFYPNSDTVFMRGGFKFRPSQASMYLTCFVYGNAGVAGTTAAVFDALSLYEISAAEYAALDSMTAEQIAQRFPYTEGLRGVTGPYIIRYAADGTTIEDYMIFDATFHGNPITGVYDHPYFDENGQARMVKWFEELTLDGSLNWTFSADGTGIKTIITDAILPDHNMNTTTSDHTGVKYDGKILINSGSSGADIITVYPNGHANYKKIAVQIADTDSGWPEAWTGTEITTDWIKALTNGWKYTGTADKVTQTWVSVLDGTSSPTQTLAYVSQNKAPNWKGWASLLYQLATPVDVSVTVEGAINLHEGTNVLEVGTGIVRREVVTPVDDPNNPYYFINSLSAGFESGRLKNRANKILSVYRNGQIDTQRWTRFTNNAYGNEMVRISDADYDPSAAYSVTYLVLDRYLYTAPLTSIEGEYRTKLAGVVAENSKDIADLATRVSVVETQYARKQQGQWIPLVLLSPATNYGNGYEPAGYYKDEFGVVHLKGVITGHTIGAAFTRLPPGCRPKYTRIRPAMAADQAARVNIYSDGQIMHQTGGTNGYLSLDGISFRAEQ